MEGTSLAGHASWPGPPGRVRNSRIALTVQSTTAVVVRIRAAGDQTVLLPALRDWPG
jgi:hypothetical protein